MNKTMMKFQCKRLPLLLYFIHLSNNSILTNASIVDTDFCLMKTRFEDTSFDDQSSCFHDVLQGPGYIDLSTLEFTALDLHYSSMSDDITTDYNDFYVNNEGDSNNTNKSRNAYDDLNQVSDINATTLDVVVFRVPNNCIDNPYFCDWPSLGVGAHKNLYGFFTKHNWCCTQGSIDMGLCEDAGQLIINETLFQGIRRFIKVPGEGPMEKHITDGKIEVHTTGRYFVVFANCKAARGVDVKGEMVWKSSHGYLPESSLSYLYFHIYVAIVYVILALWYGVRMRVYHKSRIPVEKWILATICFGLLETIFCCVSYFVWNIHGRPVSSLFHSQELANIFKRGFSHILLLMLALGWGVVRNSLSKVSCIIIIILGGTYVGLLTIDEFLYLFDRLYSLPFYESFLYRLLQALHVIRAKTFYYILFLDVVFVVWTMCALCGTMRYLKSYNQTRKLTQHRYLYYILLVGILLRTLGLTIAFNNIHCIRAFIAKGNGWIFGVAATVWYIITLIGIAVLWRPNVKAREYSGVVELPVTGVLMETVIQNLNQRQLRQ